MKPRIIIPIDIRNKIQFMVDNCPLEISGLGTVLFVPEENAYRVTEILLIDQEVGAAHTDLDDNAVAKACYEMRDCEGELAFWWHSHVNMGTGWSGTDHSTMEAIGKNGLCVAVVFNKREEMRGAIVMSPEGFPITKHDNVDITVEHHYNFDTEELLTEMKEKVRVKKYAPIQPQPSLYTPSVFRTQTLNEELEFEREAKNIATEEWKKMTKTEKAMYQNFNDFYEEDYLFGGKFGHEIHYSEKYC